MTKLISLGGINNKLPVWKCLLMHVAYERPQRFSLSFRDHIVPCINTSLYFRWQGQYLLHPCIGSG